MTRGAEGPSEYLRTGLKSSRNFEAAWYVIAIDSSDSMSKLRYFSGPPFDESDY